MKRKILIATVFVSVTSLVLLGHFVGCAQRESASMPVAVEERAQQPPSPMSEPTITSSDESKQAVSGPKPVSPGETELSQVRKMTAEELAKLKLLSDVKKEADEKIKIIDNLEGVYAAVPPDAKDVTCLYANGHAADYAPWWSNGSSKSVPVLGEIPLVLEYLTTG